MTSGRTQRKRSTAGRVRQPNLSRFYNLRAPDIDWDAITYKVTIKRPNRPPINLASSLEALEIDDSGGGLNATLTVRRPGNAKTMPIKRGHLAVCTASWQGKHWELWRMNVDSVETDVTGTLTVSLTDPLTLLNRNRRDWHFGRDKAHKKGWLAHEIVRKVAKREGVHLGRIAKGTHRIRSLKKKNTTALSIIAAAYKEESEATGRRFRARFRNGLFEVQPYRRNDLLYVLHQQIVSGNIVESAKENPATSITATGRVGKGKDAKKRKVTVVDHDAVRRLGYVHRDIKAGTVASVSALRSKARRKLAEGLRTKKTITVTHPAIPFIRRGDGIRVVLDDDFITGKESYVFVSAINFALSADSRTMTLELTVDDPFTADLKRQAKDRKAREKKRREKSKKK